MALPTPTSQALDALYDDDSQIADFIEQMPKESGAHGQLRLGKKAAGALVDTQIAQRISDADPFTQDLRGKADRALAGLQPQRYDVLGREVARQAGIAEDRFGQSRGQALDTRGQLLGAIGQTGQLPSAVDQQARIQAERARRQIASQAASGRGGFSPSAQRAALMATGRSAAAIGADAAAARAAEQRQALAMQLAGLRGVQAGDMAQQGADLQAGQSLANLAAGQAGIIGRGDQQRGALVDAFQNRENQVRGRFTNALAGIRGQGAGGGGPSAWEQGLGLAGTAAAATLPLLMMSDETAKTSIHEQDDELESFLDSLQAYKYRYKDPDQEGAADGDQVGVMAQDLEGSKLGRDLVHEGDDGYKRVDYSPEKMGPLVLAALANLNKRINRAGKKR